MLSEPWCQLSCWRRFNANTQRPGIPALYDYWTVGVAKVSPLLRIGDNKA